MSISLDTSPKSWEQVVCRIGFLSAIHPFEYAKFLIQVGHEPMAPYRAKNIYGKMATFYPSIFSYIRHIKQVDGIGGCYRGLAPNIMSKVVGGLVCQRVGEEIKVENEEAPEESLTEDQILTRLIRLTYKESVSRAVGIIVSHPLHVIALRTMAEFVGREGVYKSVLSSFALIIKQEGVLGLFSGLIPRVLGDFACVWVCNTVVFFFNSYYIEDKEAKVYSAATLRFMIGTMLYPLQLIGSCMAISGSNLVAATPPKMPIYDSWLHCYVHLRVSRALRRGATLFWRDAAGPILFTVAGQPILPNPDIFGSIKAQ